MQSMRLKTIFLTIFLCMLSINCNAQQSPDAPTNPWAITSMTVAGGPILSKHFQSGADNFNEHHTIGIVKLSTEDRGNWGVYFLSPNSVRRTSIGGGYITDPYTIPLGPTQLELTGGIGLVTGYQNYPLPLLSADARLALYQSGPWNAGLEMAAMPYIAVDDATDKKKVGIVATTPFLSVRYKFN
jgi:hypothetical protein